MSESLSFYELGVCIGVFLRYFICIIVRGKFLEKSYGEVKKFFGGLKISFRVEE